MFIRGRTFNVLRIWKVDTSEVTNQFLKFSISNQMIAILTSVWHYWKSLDKINEQLNE